MFFLEHFSTEMLEMILYHLNHCQELLKCTEVSPRLNNLISVSPRIMKHVKIIWTATKDTMEVPPKRRKYRALKILGVQKCSLQLLKFIQTFARTLVWLRLENCSIRQTDLHSSLSMVAPTLIEIAFVNTTVVDKRVFKKIEMPRLEYLEFSKSTPEDSDARFFIGMVKTCSLRKFLFGGYGNDLVFASAEDTKLLLKFLAAQKNLKELTLPRTVTNAAIKHWTEVKPLEAKLQSLFLSFPTLKCKCKDCNQTHFPILWPFLERQNGSLRSLLFTSAYFVDDQLQQLLTMNLRELTIVYCRLEWNSLRVTRNTSITKLFIVYKFRDIDDASVDAINHMLMSCEAVTNVMVTFDKYDDRLRPVLNKIVHNPKITNMTVHNISCLNGTTFPSVQNINVMNDNADNVFELARANPHLRSLRLESRLSQDQKFKQQLQALLPSATIS